MPSLALFALALASTSLVSGAPVAQGGPWWPHPSGSWSSWGGSWGPWHNNPSAAPATATAAPAAASSSAANVPPSLSAAGPSFQPSAQPSMASSAPTVTSQPNTPWASSTAPAAASSAPAGFSSPAASSPTASSAAPSSPSPSGSNSGGSGTGSVDTSYYSTPGDGSASAFHSFFDSKVVDFETLFSAWHSALMNNNNNDATAVQWIHDAVVAQSAASGISGSLILSVIMQESSGAISTVTTGDASGGADGGMMQCEGCPGVSSLSAATSDLVNQMLSGGVAHFQGNMGAAGGDDYTALRLYNSGSLQGTDLSNPSYAPASTPKYVEMVANRMHGWID